MTVELTDEQLVERVERIKSEFRQVDYSRPGAHLSRGIEELDSLVGDLIDQRAELLAEKRWLRARMEELEQGLHANRSRDYGRGIAYAVRQIRDASRGH